MKRREFIALIGMSVAWPPVARAQQQPTLGLLSSGELADWAINPFRAGLAEGGYVEGRNLTVIYRSAGNQFDRLPALAVELVKSQVSIIFATGSPVPARSARRPRRQYRSSSPMAAIQSATALSKASAGQEGTSPVRPSSERH